MTQPHSKHGGEDSSQELSGFLSNTGKKCRLLVLKVQVDRFDRIIETHSSQSYSTTWEKLKSSKRISRYLWHLTSSLLKLNKPPTAKTYRLPWRWLFYVSLHELWHLSKRKGPWNICVVITEGMVSPPPRLRTCIPPILAPNVQIVSTFMQVTGSHFMNHCGRNEVSPKAMWAVKWFKQEL